MYPELFRIGNFPINTYGALLALALFFGIYVSARVGQRDGLPRERIYDLGLWMTVGAILGSKLFLLWTDPVYRENPMHLLSIDFLRSGGVFYGGLFGATLTVTYGLWRYGLPWWKVADAAAVGIPLGQAIGRQGCFAAGCCWGKPTSLPWGVRFTQLAHEVTGVPIDFKLHPTQLYESLATFAFFLFLLWLHRRKRFDGQVILAYAVLYGVARFAIEFFRDDDRGDLAGLTQLTGLSTSQLLSLVVIAAGVVGFIIRWRRASTKVQLEVASPSSAARS